MGLPTLDTSGNAVSRNGQLPPPPSAPENRPDPHVAARAPRRHFSRADKLRILAEADACPAGQLGAFLRREGLYSSTLSSFRGQRDAGKLGKESDQVQIQKQRREKESARQRDARVIARLEAENQKLKVLIELQKKVAELMSLSSENQTPF